MDKIFKALGDKTRLDLLLIIDNLPNICLCDLESCFTLSKSNLSRHLKELNNAGLLDITKKGKWKYYSVSDLGQDLVELTEEWASIDYLTMIGSIVATSKRSTQC